MNEITLGVKRLTIITEILDTDESFSDISHYATCKSKRLRRLDSNGNGYCLMCDCVKNDMIKIIPCRHIFCFSCATQKFGNNEKICPICFSTVSDDWYYNEGTMWVFSPA